MSIYFILAAQKYAENAVIDFAGETALTPV
jgi:hypothetical protein